MNFTIKYPDKNRPNYAKIYLNNRLFCNVLKQLPDWGEYANKYFVNRNEYALELNFPANWPCFDTLAELLESLEKWREKAVKCG